MPYASNEDLSPAVKKAHPTAHGQNAFREAFNSAHKMYGDEETAFKVAHHAADQAEAHHGQPVQVHIHVHPHPAASMGTDVGMGGEVQPLSYPLTRHLGKN
jgi:cation transport regulator ChaB